MPRLPTLALVAIAATLPLALIAQRAAAASWLRPVDGDLARAFTYRGSEPFRAGRHRGVDFAARPGAIVRSACAGRVSFAGRVGRQGGVVSVRCGPWRVSHLPLRGLAVRAGTRVAAGDLLGRLVGHPIHAGLHLGVRRETSRWGYVDPTRFFGAAVPAPPVAGRPSRPGRPPRLGPAPPPARVPQPRPAPEPRSAPLPRPAPATVRAPAGVATAAPARAQVAPPDSPGSPATPTTTAGRPSAASTSGAPVAPWPAWLGLALLLAGAVGAGARRRRRARADRPVGSAAAAIGRAGG